YVCQSHHRIAEAVTSVLGDAQFSSGPFYHPRSSRCRFGYPRETAVGAGNFPDANGISDDVKRQNRSHHTEPVPYLQIDPPIHAWLIALATRATQKNARVLKHLFSPVPRSAAQCPLLVGIYAGWPTP